MNENGSKSPKIVTQMKQIESKSTKKGEYQLNKMI